MTCVVYLHSFGSVAQNSYWGKRGWMISVFEAFCFVIHHNKQLTMKPAGCLPCTVLISLLFYCFVCLVYLDHKLFEASILGHNGKNMIKENSYIKILSD